MRTYYNFLAMDKFDAEESYGAKDIWKPQFEAGDEVEIGVSLRFGLYSRVEMLKQAKAIRYCQLVLLFVAMALAFYRCSPNQPTQSSKSYIAAIMSSVFSTWSMPALDGQVVPGFYDASPRNEVERTFVAARNKLGVLRSYETNTVTEQLIFGTGGTYPDARYELAARFSKGHVNIYLEIAGQNGRWKIKSFRIAASAGRKP